ncbi:MAG: Ca-activated chloride channel [Solirubrobacteraceae bacterium]|nr:Ca-activated chloride channel [Solirubrobacteraceae bacterium]
MSFREPLLLAALVLVPLALAAYLAAQRRRRRYAVRYSNVEVLALAAGRDWARHVPAALALLALAALAIALARPERVVADERRQATVVMVTDVSGSMKATDVAPDRLQAAQAAGRTLAERLPADFKLGLVTFGSTADQLVAPTTDKHAVVRAIGGLKVHGATAMGDGLSLALDAAQAAVPRAIRPPAAIVLLSDGANTRGQDPITVADKAKRAGIRVYTVALGTQGGVLQTKDASGNPKTEPVPPDTGTLQEIARSTGGRFYDAANAARLREVYAGLGTRFSKLQVKQEVTAAFAGGALVLLLAGVGTSLARGGRLP